MRIAIICNGRTLLSWQRRAIELIASGNELFLLVCEDPPVRRDPRRHGLYYLLNLASVRNRANRPVTFPQSQLPVAGRHEFAPEVNGAWAALPDDTLDFISANRIDAIVKFGLNLLKVPEAGKLAAPILSYHHGDPRAYRGRPAGFHEMMAGEPFLGQVVQILSNKLDSGEVLAFAQSRVWPHSYRRTLVEAYSLSPALLPKALAALKSGLREPVEPTGRNYSLPGNTTVLRFLASAAVQALRRLAYGAFMEKHWRVSTLAAQNPANPIEGIRQANERSDGWQSFPISPPYRFHADPFFSGDAVLVEAMNGRTGKGELLRIAGGRQQLIEGFDGHVSYPSSIEEDGRTFIVPEICDWSTPAIFEVRDGRAARVAGLDIDEPAILDPTLLRHEGRIYLFGNRTSEGPSILRLWSADGLFGEFLEHPESPIRTSIRGGRMAGAVHPWPDGLFRIGQDFRAGYGDGIVAFRIEELTADRYRETEFGGASFGLVRGPHTLNLRGGALLFDWYEDRFSALSGIRRLLNRL